MTAIPSRLHQTPRRERLGILRVHERLRADNVSGRCDSSVLVRSSVHLGWLASAERLVAVKRLPPHHLADEVGITRVRAEAQLAMRVVHPNVVTTLGVVCQPGELLAVMEYVPAASLTELTGPHARGLEPHVASAILAGVLHGLHAAHAARGGSQRDISTVSSGRVLVGEDGRARILDFDVPGPTTADAIISKLPYAPPEQLVRGKIDVRRDVYAAATVLWETLTGRPLFRAATVEGTLRKILSDPVPAPSELAHVAPELDAIVMRGLARDPTARFESAGAMASALERTSCAAPEDVARALEAMDLACLRERRALADAVRELERNLLHIECSGRDLKQ
jgi:eukaryotic-like serine/threonine-protein kinase